jgi:nucleolar protein 14
VEYKQRNKSNMMVDRRFGEREEDLSVEEKMMQRFILERKV